MLGEQMPEPKKQQRNASAIINEVIERVNSDTQRLRVLEQSSGSLASRLDGLEQAMLQHKKESQKHASDLAAQISLLDERVSKAESTMKEIVEHIRKLVTQSQIKELENLVDIYNPIKSNFVTREELDKILSERLRKK